MSKEAEANSKSTISLTLGILSIVIPLIGLVPGVIGLVFSRKAIKEIIKTNENGRGLATSGFICSVVGITIQSLGVIGIIAFYSATTIG